MSDLWLRSPMERLGSVAVGLAEKEALRAAAAATGLSMRVALGLVIRGAPPPGQIRPKIRKWYPPSGWGEHDGKVSSVPVGDDRIEALKLFSLTGPDQFSPTSVAGAIYRAALAGEIEVNGEAKRIIEEARKAYKP